MNTQSPSLQGPSGLTEGTTCRQFPLMQSRMWGSTEREMLYSGSDGGSREQIWLRKQLLSGSLKERAFGCLFVFLMQ